MSGWTEQEIDAYRTGWNKAIEECARVAESYEHVAWASDDYREAIAAAIRALKKEKENATS